MISSLNGASYVVYGINGKQMVAGSIQGDTVIDVSAFEKGMYIITVSDVLGNTSVKKLQVQ
jgi:hypothetical protein